MMPAESFLQSGQADTRPLAHASFLAGGGEMGERTRAFDWASTPLGPMEQWPQNLLTLVTTSIRSRFPIVIWWGREHYTTFYNDAYIPVLGKTKHPGWLGRSGKECWSEIWPIIGPMLESVFETAQPTWSEDQLLIIDRNLPREEGYFTFSYSAIMGESSIDGIFCACTETTERVIGERRLQTLRDLASSASQGRSAEEACEIAARLLAHNTTDIPFALIYLLDRDRTTAHLVAYSDASVPALNEARTTALSSQEASSWPLEKVAREGIPALVSPLPGEWKTLPAGPWPEPADAALVLPILTPGHNQVTGLLVVGVNPRRELDASYRDFFQMVAGHVATAVANARAYEEERRRAEALAELDRAKTLFFSNISHEFRTPLTLMLGPIEDLLTANHTLSSAQRDQAEILRRNTLRLLRLVNTLLDFSRIEAGRMEALYEPVDLAALTTDLASNFRSAIEKAGMTLSVACPSLAVPVYVDRQMWEKIVLNLLSNAFKYTWQGTITVTIAQKETMVELSVADTGVGIPAEELPHMFERFHRVKGTEGRTFEGTGIGLSLVQELVKLHGGTIYVASTYGQGSTFTISLPLGTAHLPAERMVAGRTLPSTVVSASTYVEEALQLLAGQEAVPALLSDMPLPAGTSFPISRSASKEERKSPPRILFADDNADMRDYVCRLLRPHYDVQVAADGKTALALVRASQPDLVLADVMMPGMDGFELLQALRSTQETRNIPVMLLSARAGEEARVEGMQAGADDYLIKPFSARELLARIGAHLEIARLRTEAEVRLKAERQHLYDLLMQAPAAVAIMRGPLYVIELINPITLQIWGRTSEQMLNKPLFEALPELRGQGFESLLTGVLTTGIPFVGQEMKVLIDRTGTGQLMETYFTFVYSPLRTDQGAIDGIMVFAYEVTDQVLARRLLVEQMQLLELIAAGLPLADVLCEVTSAVARLQPHTRASVLLADVARTKFAKIYAADLPPTFGAGLQDAPINDLAIGTCGAAVFSGQPITCADIAHDDRWSQMWRELCVAHGILACHSAPIISAKGEVVASLMLCFDEAREPGAWELSLAAFGTHVASIAIERDRTMQALRESEERFRTLADHMSQLAWMRDETGWIFWYNQRWYDYTDTTFAEMQDGGWQNVLHPDHVERVVAKIRRCFQSGEEWEDTFPLRGSDGTYRWFLSRAIPIRDGQGNVLRWFGTNTDITEQRRLEQQKDEFLGVASHELKTPITSLKVYAQLLEYRFRQSGDGHSADLLGKMDVQLNKLTSLVEDLLDVTRIENGQLPYHFSSFEMNTLISEVVEEVQRAAPRHRIRQVLVPSVTIYADRERIGQVLTNLLTNAIKYSPLAETVLVKTERTTAALITSVQDFGIGIAKEKQSHLFERFYRVQGDNQITYPGLGLGLYIAAECVKRHEGTIWVESEPGSGTTVSFSLPLLSTGEKKRKDDGASPEKNPDR